MASMRCGCGCGGRGHGGSSIASASARRRARELGAQLHGALRQQSGLAQEMARGHVRRTRKGPRWPHCRAKPQRTSGCCHCRCRRCRGCRCCCCCCCDAVGRGGGEWSRGSRQCRCRRGGRKSAANRMLAWRGTRRLAIGCDTEEGVASGSSLWRRAGCGGSRDCALRRRRDRHRYRVWLLLQLLVHVRLQWRAE